MVNGDGDKTLKMKTFLAFKVSWPWPWIRSNGVYHWWTSATSMEHILFESKKLCGGRTDIEIGSNRL